MPSIVLLTNRTAPSQKPRLMPPAWALLEKGNWPSVVNFWPPLMFSKFVESLARAQAGPSSLPVGCSFPTPAVQSYTEPPGGGPQTSVEPINEVKVGNGQAQFVVRPNE